MVAHDRSQLPEKVFQLHSGIAEQAACVAARYEQRMVHTLPFSSHMYWFWHVATLTGSVMLTAIAEQASVQTRLTLSHMHMLSPVQVAAFVYESEQCCAQAPDAVMKQLGSFLHVCGSLMPLHTWPHCWSCADQTHVVSPEQSVAVARDAHVTPHAPVCVTLQSGRDAQLEPTYGHCVEQVAVASFHSQIELPRQLLLV